MAEPNDLTGKPIRWTTRTRVCCAPPQMRAHEPETLVVRTSPQRIGADENEREEQRRTDKERERTRVKKT